MFDIGPIGKTLFDRIVGETKARGHNLPPEMLAQALTQAVDETFDAVTAKCHRYRSGLHLLASQEATTYFNTLSLGNWVSLAEHLGIPVVPARYAGSLPAVKLFALSQGAGEALTQDDWSALSEIVGALTQAQVGDVLRWDPCMTEEVKVAACVGAVPVGRARGWCSDGDHPMPVFDSERLAHQFLAWPEPNLPVPAWIRPWIDARREPGFAPDGEPALVPVEWRVYVLFGEVVAVSSFYPRDTDEPSARDRAEIAEAVSHTRRMIDLLGTRGFVPHHPRYEAREGFDPDAMHFSLDFLSCEDGTLRLLEGGPAHLRAPAFGAHPCSFGVKTPPEGLAIGRFLDTAMAF